MPTRLVAALLAGIALAGVPASAAKTLSVLGEGSHCVAYKAKKRVFFVTTVSVIGKSCDVAVQVTPEVEGKFHIELSFPVRSLKSGEAKRDRDVADLLDAENYPDLLFISDSLTAEEWRALSATGAFAVNGHLQIADDKHPVRADVRVSKGPNGLEADGVVKTSFKYLKLKPPKLAMGLMASVKDDLELHFHFMGQRTLGADSIFKAEN
jgi:polyisoprenoid-binding protein YceI